VRVCVSREVVKVMAGEAGGLALNNKLVLDVTWLMCKSVLCSCSCLKDKSMVEHPSSHT